MVPQDLVDLLTAAESDYQVALNADHLHDQAVTNLAHATQDEHDAQGVALTAHQTASASGNAAVTAIKAHFGL